MTARPRRVVQWTTGNVAHQTVRAVLGRDDLELVGVYAHSAAKVGRDVAELVGLDEPVGVTATDDLDALLALDPDCVLYTPLHPDPHELCRLLEAGALVLDQAVGEALPTERATCSPWRCGRATTGGRRS